MDDEPDFDELLADAEQDQMYEDDLMMDDLDAELAMAEAEVRKLFKCKATINSTHWSIPPSSTTLDPCCSPCRGLEGVWCNFFFKRFDSTETRANGGRYEVPPVCREDITPIPSFISLQRKAYGMQCASTRA